MSFSDNCLGTQRPALTPAGSCGCAGRHDFSADTPIAHRHAQYTSSQYFSSRARSARYKDGSSAVGASIVNFRNGRHEHSGLPVYTARGGVATLAWWRTTVKKPRVRFPFMARRLRNDSGQVVYTHVPDADSLRYYMTPLNNPSLNNPVPYC